MSRHSVSFSILLILLPFFLWAQKLNTQSKKAEKYFIEAQNEFTLGNHLQAELLLTRAIDTDKNFQEAYLLFGDMKADQGYPLDAIDYYKKGLAINPNAFPNGHYFLASLYLKEGLYPEALSSLEMFLNFKNVHTILMEEAEFQRQNCLFALEAIKHPVDFELKNLGPNINTDKSEYFPTLRVDNQFLLFTRQIDKPNKGVQEDFIGAVSLNDSLWQKSFPIYDLNTPFNEGAASLSADGKTLVFTACENFGDYGDGRKGFGSCDLFFALKKGDRWGKATNMGSPINTSNWESQPSLSADGRSIYFVRAPKKTQGSSDIYRSDKNEFGFWNTPVKLGESINTDKDEQSVFIHPDNQTLYFSSNGHIGMGSTDLFMSKWDTEKQDWGKAINLGYPINTYKDENSIMVAPDGKLGYFASERKDGFGALDLYSFQLPKNLQPEKITYFKGIVFDAKTEEPLGAQFELIDIETGKQFAYSLSDEYDGSFLVSLNLGKDYLLNVSKPSYLFYSDQFLVQKEFSNQSPFIKDIPLQAIALGEMVVLKNIFFATNESTFHKSSEFELMKLIEFLNDNPSIRIEIQGHTDTVGTDEYNMILSTARAKAVYDYLIEHQITKDRIAYQGFGLSRPVSTNDTEEGRAQNRRTEFMVIQIYNAVK